MASQPSVSWRITDSGKNRYWSVHFAVKEQRMAIAKISTPPLWYRSQIQETEIQIRQGFANLSKALQAGDVSTAQSTIAALQKLQPSQVHGTPVPGLVSTDFMALDKALQTGDVRAAQRAFQQLQHDLQSTRHGHPQQHAAGAQQANVYTEVDKSTRRVTDSVSDQDGFRGSRLNVYA